MTLPLVLASSSSYRRMLLQRLLLPFVWASPDIDETPLAGENIEAMTARLAIAKARALTASYPQALIIGSDQACVLEGVSTIIGKPGGFERARQQLRACSGRNLIFHTSLVLLNSQTGASQSSHDVFSVRFRQLTDAEICRYLELEQPYDCAGSFKAEGLGIALFEGMAGNDFHSLIGLPLINLCQMLRQNGLNPLKP
ncbi:MAG: Maf family nucleotide pyrophosphatase [Gammaproteobacteria bacterium]